MAIIRGLVFIVLSLLAEAAAVGGCLLLLMAAVLYTLMEGGPLAPKNNHFLKEMEDFEKKCV